MSAIPATLKSQVEKLRLASGWSAWFGRGIAA